MGKKKIQCDCTICTKWKESELQVFEAKVLGHSIYFIGWNDTKQSFKNAVSESLRQARQSRGDFIKVFEEFMERMNFVPIRKLL